MRDAFTAEERRELLRLKLRAWSGKPRLRLKKKPAPEQRQARPDVRPSWSPPSPTRWRRLFSKNTPWEELELERVDLGARQLFVPASVLVTGGARSWRCTEVP